MNSNIPPFYPGQKVVYITGIHMPKNSIHTVVNCVKDNCGKCWALIIETPANRRALTQSELNSCSELICSNCGTHYSPKQYKHIDSWDPNSFRALTEEKMIKVEFHKLMEEVPVCAN